MEVDDAATIPSKEKAHRAVSHLKSGRHSRPAGRRHLFQGKLNEAKHSPRVMQVPSPENHLTTAISESKSQFGTTLKQMSGNRERYINKKMVHNQFGSRKRKSNTEGSKLLGPPPEEKGSKEALDAILKRKRYNYRYPGSENMMLIGFDVSGEPKFAKDNIVGKDERETNILPKKKTREITSTRQLQKEEVIEGTSLTKLREDKKVVGGKLKTVKSLSGLHIVGDNEDINGVLCSNILAYGNTSPSSIKSSSPVKMLISSKDEIYKVPFKYGWKRELVWRATSETSKDRADVYYVTPKGKKLRTRSEISSHLESNLTLDNFCFSRETIGAGPQFETVRHAKPSSRSSSTATLPANIGKRISKPKGPKGASPPPEGWTPTRALKVNNALWSSCGSIKSNASNTFSATPINRINAAISLSKTVKINTGNIGTDLQTTNISNSPQEPCTIICSKAQGQVPQLQCVKCLCLFHHECVGLNVSTCQFRTIKSPDVDSENGQEYICEACFPPMSAPIVSALTQLCENTTQNSLQSIAVVKGRKYVSVSIPTTVQNKQAFDIAKNIKNISENIVSDNSEPTGFPNTIELCNKIYAANFFGNMSLAYDILIRIFRYLKIHERSRASSVCKLWHLAAKDTSLWRIVRMKNSKVCDWGGFTAALRRGETNHLDLRKVLLSNVRTDEMWQDFSRNIGTVSSLDVIDLCRCSAHVVEGLFFSNTNLRVLNAVALKEEPYNLENISKMKRLEELRLRTSVACNLNGDLKPLKSLDSIVHLSLTALCNLGTKSIEVLGELNKLKSLELGECADFDFTFSDTVLPRLLNLQRIRLEKGPVSVLSTAKILESVSNLKKLEQLELINFDIKPEFEEMLKKCTNINKLLIIPTYISQSATTNHIMLSAVQQIANTLKIFTWGVTVELLRVTALYMAQCEGSTKKQKHSLDKCIPVLKPVPGAMPSDGLSTLKKDIEPNSVPQIEILTLDKVESIMSENLPNTKFTIVRVPYHMTWKQQIVE